MDESINLDPKGRILSVSYCTGLRLGSLVTSIALARFILHDELVPAFTCASLMGCKAPSHSPFYSSSPTKSTGPVQE
jgi:hypothetical protein